MPHNNIIYKAIYNGILCASSKPEHGFPMACYVPVPNQDMDFQWHIMCQYQTRTWISIGILCASSKPGHGFPMAYYVPVPNQNMDFQ